MWWAFCYGESRKVVYEIKGNSATVIGTTSKKVKSVNIKNTITLNGKKYKKLLKNANYKNKIKTK